MRDVMSAKFLSYSRRFIGDPSLIGLTRRLLLPRLVSLSVRIIESSARTRLFLGPRLHISKAYPGLIDLDLRN
jgi:hypothetical protein